ncbi:MAG: Fibronectin type domain protein [Gemmatimonadetes bacterium]|nr:Fibronectin type domain protein [Gemmatimonadota bacterium]
MRTTARTILSIAAGALLLAGAAACSSDSTGSSTPDVPSGVAAVVSSPTAIRVQWNQVPNATGYRVERTAAGAAYATVADNLTATVYDDTGLAPGTSYSYRIHSVRGGSVSDASQVVNASTAAEAPKVRTLYGITQSTTLYADSLYVLSGYVKVSNGATLTIQPGTRIVGDTLTPGSSLWILRGSKIQAVGTADKPIVFTSARTADNRKPGDWGGIVIVGNAPINRTATPIFTEGPVGAAENYAGGSSWTDNSGTLKYVRVEFAGYDVSNGAGQELNSISSYAVGSGTTYDYVQSMAGLDDSFEFFGGAVDIRHMVSYEAGDDHYDWTEGYRGRGQYLIALQTTVVTPRAGTGTVSSDPRGFEGDGCENDKAGCTYANTPYSQPVWANFTVIGPGTGVFSPADGNGAVIRRGSAGTLVNGVIGRWPLYGISIRDAATKALLDADSLTIRNVVLSDNGSNFEPAGTNFGSVLSDGTRGIREVAGVGALFTALPAAKAVPTAATLDWTPAAGSALLTGGLSSFAGTKIAGRVTSFFGADMPATAYVGAADPAAAKWWAGWTVYATR